MNDKSYIYLHPATGIFTSVDLSLCHPSLLLDFDWSVSEDQHGSDHFPIVIASVIASAQDHNPKWKLNKANWEQFHSLFYNFWTSKILITPPILSLILHLLLQIYQIDAYQRPRQTKKKATHGTMMIVRMLLDKENML